MKTKIPNLPPDIIFSIDLNPCKGFLVDLPAGATRGMRSEKDGWSHVRSEILDKQTKFGDRAGISAADFNRFVALDDQIDQIRARLPAVIKAVEVVKESLCHLDNQRHKLATQFATSAESHASAEGGDPTLVTAYEKAIAYRGAIGVKAAKTRQKNAEVVKDGGSPAPEPGGKVGMGGKAAVSRIPNPPPENIFTIDLKPLKGFLVDLPDGAMRGMRTEQEGWADVVQEVVANQAALGDRAGITMTDFNRFVALNAQYEEVRLALPALEKAEEVLRESLAYVDHQRHKLATQFAGLAESHASAEGGDPTLLTAYEKTIAYRAVTAIKGVKTRRKNEAARRAAALQSVAPPSS